MSTPFSVDELRRYSRQIYLKELGYTGQAAIRQSHALIIGLGGLGSPASLYLTATGIGKLTLADFDKVELSNLQRQVIHTTQDLNKNKALSASETIQQLNPHVVTEIITEKLNEPTLKRLLNQVDVVLDCSDNFKTRYHINKLCKKQRVPLVSAAVISFQGQLIAFDFRKDNTPCYACLFSDYNEQGLNCNEAGVLGSAAGILGTMQATETLKLLCNLLPEHTQLLILDTLSWQQRLIKFQINPKCQLCNNL